MKFKKLTALIASMAMAVTLAAPFSVVSAADDPTVYTWDFTNETFWSDRNATGGINAGNSVKSDQNEETIIMTNPGAKLAHNTEKKTDKELVAKVDATVTNAVQFSIPDGNSAKISMELTAGSSNQPSLLKASDGTVVIDMANPNYTKNVFSTYDADLKCNEVYTFDTSAGKPYIGKVVLTVYPKDDEGGDGGDEGDDNPPATETNVYKFSRSQGNITGGNQCNTDATYTFVSGADEKLTTLFADSDNEAQVDAELIKYYLNYVGGYGSNASHPSITLDAPAGKYKALYLGYNHGNNITATVGDVTTTAGAGIEFAENDSTDRTPLKLYTVDIEITDENETVTFDSSDQWLPDLYAIVVVDASYFGDEEEPDDPVETETPNEYKVSHDDNGKTFTAPFYLIKNSDIKVYTTNDVVVGNNKDFDSNFATSDKDTYDEFLPFRANGSSMKHYDNPTAAENLVGANAKEGSTNIAAAPNVNGTIIVHIGIASGKSMYIYDNTISDFIVKDYQISNKGVCLLEQKLTAGHEYLIFAAGTDASFLKVEFVPDQNDEPEVDFKSQAEYVKENGTGSMRFLTAVTYDGDEEVSDYGYWFVNLNDGKVEVKADSLKTGTPEDSLKSGDTFFATFEGFDVGEATEIAIYAVPWVTIGSVVQGTPFTYGGSLDVTTVTADTKLYE